MTEFDMRSNHGSDRLEIWIIKPGDEWRAQIDFGDRSARGEGLRALQPRSAPA